MKHITYFCFACLLVLASGCASNRQIVLDAAVGPARPIVQNSPPEGRLVVYSALDAVSVTGSDQADWKQTPNADVVKRPDGTVIGWRALDMAESQ
jgi:hypothetical protein